jgi:hypothetical protein
VRERGVASGFQTIFRLSNGATGGSSLALSAFFVKKALYANASRITTITPQHAAFGRQ